MRLFYIFFLLCFYFHIAKADVGTVLLTESQIKALHHIKTVLQKSDTSYTNLTLIWKSDTALSKIPLDDVRLIMRLLHPLNEIVYHDSIQHYALCKKIAQELADKILEDIASESADEKFGIIHQLKMEKGQYFKINLCRYFQNQIFDFYYNNKVTTVLGSEEYLKLLKPKAVYKLLKDTKTENLLNSEILFIANNSQYNL